MTRRILVLFPDEWDRAAAHDPWHRGRYEFFFEGFDLFSFPENLRLFTFDALAFVERIARRYRHRGLHGVVTSDEQFGPFIAALVAERLGLPHARLGAVLTIQHKYHARQAFERIAPECNTPFALLRRDYARPEDVGLPFPFYVKPSKAAFSVLARRVDSFEDLRGHTTFGWLERTIIERLVQPFADVSSVHAPLAEDPFSMVAEGIVHGHQVTANGFVREGRVTMLGIVDSLMYPGTDQFQRFQYPSSLPAAQLARIEAVATKVMEGLELHHGMFNLEARVDPVTGEVRVIEVNPRVAGQFYDLFERVDGYSLFEALLALECGEEPAIRRRAGRDRHAASFVLRDLHGIGLARWPSRAELRALRNAHPDVRMMFYPKRAADLGRELKWLGSYRYAVLNMGAATLESMFERFHRVCAGIAFHPRGHPASLPAALAPEASPGDD